MLELLVWCIIFLVILIMATQVIMPVFSGEPMFPLFRKSAVKTEIVKAEKTLETVAEAAHLKQLSDEIQRRSSALTKEDK